MRTSTGFLSFLVIFLQTLRNSCPSPISSRYITITSVCLCFARIFSMSTSLITALFPKLTTAEKPIPCALASSTSAAQIAPLCETSAIFPDFGVTLRKVEFIIVFGSRFMIPRQLGPMTSILYFLAISMTCCSLFAPSSSTSLKPAVMMITPLTFFFPHSSKTGVTSVFLITITARSIGFGTSKTDLYAFL